MSMAMKGEIGLRHIDRGLLHLLLDISRPLVLDIQLRKIFTPVVSQCLASW